MNGAGVNIDQSHVWPSARADQSPRAYLMAPRRKPRLAWVQRMAASWPPAPVPGRETDCTVEEGVPTVRADLPVDFC